MPTVNFTIIFPADPLGPKIGGAESFIKGLIEAAPEDFNIQFIGTTSNLAKRPLRIWTTQCIGRRQFRFYPLLHESNEDIRRKIPLSLRFVFTWLLHRPGLHKGVILHNRIETLVVPRRSDSPAMVVIHNDIRSQISSGPSEVLWSRFPLLYNVFQRIALKRAARIYTVSSNTLDELNTNYPDQAQLTSFIPTWVDSSKFKPTATTKQELRARLEISNNIPAAGKLVLFVGRLQPQKAPERVLRTFEKFRRTTATDAQLVLIGDGNLRAQTECLAHQLNVDTATHFLGSLAREEVLTYYQAADVLLLASDYEGMPITLLEAQASGLPVVTTNVGEVDRIVDDGMSGIVVDSHTPEDLASALDFVVSHPGKFSIENCVAAISDHSPSAALDKMFTDVRSLCGSEQVVPRDHV